MHSYRIFFVLAVLVLWPACTDGQLEKSPSTDVVIDLGPLFQQTTRGMQVECVTVAERALLRIDDRLHSWLPISNLVTSVVFEDIRVRPGSVRFDVDIVSDTDVVLFTGGSTVEVQDDPFHVEIALRLENGMLSTCPADQHVTENGGWFEFTNIGNRTITVTLPDLPSSCGGPCFEYIETPRSFSLAPGDEVSGWIQSTSRTSGVYTLSIGSSVGHTDVIVRVP
jgi:hypothetical protein